MSVKSVRNLGVVGAASQLALATAAASTLQELISTIPRSYQALLGDYLTKKYRVMHKFANVQSTVTSYERHLTEASLPPVIRNSLKEPKLQFAKEFLASTEGTSAPENFRESIKTARSQALEAALKLKKQELAHLSTLIASEPIVWDGAVLNVVTRIADGIGGRVRKITETGKISVEGVPAAALAEYNTMSGAAEVYTYRCLALARASIDRTDLLKLSKINLKSDADTMMIDSGVDTGVKDLIKEQLEAFRKEMKAIKGTSKPALKRPGTLLIEESRSKSAHQKRSQAERQTACEERWEERRGQEKGPETETEVSLDAFLQSCSREFRPWKPEEYPDMYCILNDRCRTKIAVGLLHEWEADSMRTARPSIFKFNDVHIPEDIEYALAVNHKYIFHSRMQSHDVTNASARFARTVRIRWQFRDQHRNEEFEPKFHVPNPTWEPQLASAAIELGINEAMREIDSQVGRALASVDSDTPFRSNLRWSEVQKFLESEKILVKLTDKNLGIAAFPVEWYVHECMKMLGDIRTYHMAASLDVEKLFNKMIEQAEKWNLPRSMDKYLREKTKKEIPVFHAIPKVHKEPWSLRPIVPSHSWVTSCLSEIIDHLCRPILARLPWVVDSTKSVVGMLEQVKSNSDRCWIVTGDVVAFYTNINAAKCADVVAGAWGRYEKDSKIRPRFIRQMIEFVMNNNYFRFQDQVWKQLEGLAMGTACAPCLANIYAGFYERQLRIPMYKGVRTYMRYIDDIALIFEGTEEELMDFLSKVKLGTLTINWSFSQVKKEFLDIEIMNLRLPTGSVIATRLFKKPMNKHLYIPWSSAHPLHVKKAFVKAELIRFTIVSSRVEYFAEACRSFYGNLRRRGYPPQTLENWFHQVRYDNRPVYLAGNREDTEETPFMLSGQYNPVWEYINVEEVIRKAKRGWSLERELPESLRQSLIRSLSRSRNLGDVLSAWNKTILHTSMLSSEDVESDGVVLAVP
jgi:hypothetical protein